MVPHDLPVEAVPASSEEEQEEWKQAVSLLDCIRSTAVCGNMTPCLLPFLDAYNGIYDNAVKRGWLKGAAGASAHSGGNHRDRYRYLALGYAAAGRYGRHADGLSEQSAVGAHGSAARSSVGASDSFSTRLVRSSSDRYRGIGGTAINDTIQASVADVLSELDPDGLNDEILERIEEALAETLEEAMQQFHS